MGRVCFGTALAIVCCASLLLGCGKRSSESSLDTFLKQADELLSQNRTARAITVLQQAIRLYPKEPEPYLKLGLIYEQLTRNPRGAIDMYKKYLALEPDAERKRQVQEWIAPLEKSIGETAVEPVSPPVTEGAEDVAAVRQQYEERLTSMRSEYEAAQQLLSSKLRQAEDKAKALDETQQELTTANEDRQRLEAELKAAQQELENLKAASRGGDEAATAIADLQARHDKAVADINEKHAKEIAALQEKLAAAESRPAGAEGIPPEQSPADAAKIAELQQALEQLGKEHEAARADAQAARSELEKVRTQHDSLTSANAALGRQLADVRAEVASLRRMTSREGRRNLAMDLTEARQELAKERAKSAQYLETNNALKSRCETLLVQIVRLRAEVVRLGGEVSPSTTQATPAAETKPHLVREGDTLRSLAQRYYGDSSKWEIIYEANRNLITDPNNIRVGDTIQIPVLK